MPAGLGGGGWLAISLEAVMGTYQPPTTAGTVWVPILSENLVYREDKYYSPQIRQQTIVSDVAQSFYHAEGDIRMEVDPNFWPYFMYASRHLITKVGAVAPFTYTFSPSSAGSASTAASGAVARTASITVVRNGQGFGYAGCTIGGYEITLENGVMLATLNTLGLSETDVGTLGTPAWVDPHLFGAAAHSVYLDAAGITPTFAAAADKNHDGFTFRANFNATAQNRIVSDRAATYIAFGESEVNYETRLDFIDKTEYTNMKNNTTRAIKLESLRGGATFALAPEAHQIIARRSSYDTYEVALAGLGDLILADVNGRVIGIAGANAYDIVCKSSASIT